MTLRSGRSQRATHHAESELASRSARSRSVLALAVVSLAGFGSVGVARAATTPTLTVTLTSALPSTVPAGSGILQLTGQVSATAKIAHISLTLSARGFTERGQLEAARGGTVQNTTPIQATPHVGTGTAGPGHPGKFRVTTTGTDIADVVGAGTPASDLTVSVSATGPGGIPVQGSVQLRMPNAPTTAPAAPPVVSLIIPVTDPPSAESPAQSPTPSDLANLVNPVGRIAGILTAVTDGVAAGGPRAAVTLAVDPALVDRLCAATGCGSTHPAAAGVPQVIASEANELRQRLITLSQTAGVTVTALPYSDADLDSVVGSGHPDVAARLLESGQDLADDLGGSAAAVEPAIPAGGTLTAATLQLLAEHGVRTVVLNQAAMPPASSSTLTATPTALGTLSTPSGAVAGLAEDPVLQQLLTTADAGSGAPTGAVEDLLAEASTLAAERPNDVENRRSVVLVAPRLWNASPAYVKGLVAGIGNDPWLAPDTTAAATSLRPIPRTPHLVAPADALPHDVVSAGEALRARADTATDVIATPAVQAAVSEPLQHSLDISYSAWWRSDPATARSLQSGVETSVDTVLAGIGLSHASSVLVTGSTGKLPVLLVNRLPYPVTLRVALDPVTTSRVLATHEDVTIPAAKPGGEQRLQESLSVVSRTSGRFPVKLQLETTSGAQLGPPEEVRVTSHNYGRLAVGITAGGLFFLVAALIFRAVRALRRHRRGAHSAPVTTPT